jgi:transglutaminase-like putative cysteine protease
MKLHVSHRTRYDYASAVRESFNEARLQPVTDRRQTCHDFKLVITPACKVSHYQDFHANTVHLFEINHSHLELDVSAVSAVTTTDTPALPPDAIPAPLTALAASMMLDGCYEFLPPSTYVEVTPETEALARSAAGGATDVWQAAQAIMHTIHREFHYQPASTNVHTHMREVLKARHGVCQDFAHVMLGFCRALKIPARYISGYLYNGPADQLKGAQASHAWVEVHVPGQGWCGLDPTNAQPVAGHHVKVAAGRDYADVSPLKGTYRGTDRRKMTVEVLVQNLNEMSAVAG